MLQNFLFSTLERGIYTEMGVNQWNGETRFWCANACLSDGEWISCGEKNVVSMQVDDHDQKNKPE